MNSLPPLNTLRFFEAAARHLSFTRAAAELSVTQAAVSHQIKTLEQGLGVLLFRRVGRRLELTDEGQLLWPVLRESLQRIAAVSEQLSHGLASGPLTVMLRTYFSSRWLSPRLHRFWQRYPDIDLRLHHTAETSAFSFEQVDVNIRWGVGGWEGVESDLLFQAPAQPVCSPALLERGAGLHTPRDALSYTLLHDGNDAAWTEWLGAAGVTVEPPLGGPVIDDGNVRMEWVLEGRGIAIVPVALIADELASGRVIRPFAAVLSDRAYYVVYPRGALARSKVKAFRDWMVEEAATGSLGRVPPEASVATADV